MSLWGGLCPIPSRVALDASILLILCYCAAQPADNANTLLLLSTFAATIATSGLTLRWPLTFPLVPFVLTQLVLRRQCCSVPVIKEDGGTEYSLAFCDVTIGTLSGLCIATSAVLCVLFPALEFRPLRGRYNVGVVDVHLPVDMSDGRRRGCLLGTESFVCVDDGEDDGGAGGGCTAPTRRTDYVTARILYPTLDTVGEKMPYLDPSRAHRLCAKLMKVGAPGPLKSFGFMMHTWRLTRIEALRNARPLPSHSCRNDDIGKDVDDGEEKKEEEEEEEEGEEKYNADSTNAEKRRSGKGMPLAVYSHGLTGVSALYSYQALRLAADGTCVLMVDHTDGSAPAVERADGSVLTYDDRPAKKCFLEKTMEYADYVRTRRAQANHRVEEVLAALESFRLLNRVDSNDANHDGNMRIACGVSFVDKLDVSDVTMIGHSFGGATALATAARRPDVVTSVVAHEPALDWMPDSARRALFPNDGRLDGAHGGRYSGGTGGYRDGYEEKIRLEDGSDGRRVDVEGRRIGEIEDEKKEEENSASASLVPFSGSSSLHNVDMLFLYSEEWEKAGWGEIPLIKHMHQTGRLGPPDWVSDVAVISGTKHQEFSDTCMMTPVWLGRATGLTGKRNPHDTADEIALRTLSFLQVVRKKQE